jgi:hypothetical protein
MLVWGIQQDACTGTRRISDLLSLIIHEDCIFSLNRAQRKVQSETEVVATKIIQTQTRGIIKGQSKE